MALANNLVFAGSRTELTVIDPTLTPAANPVNTVAAWIDVLAVSGAHVYVLRSDAIQIEVYDATDPANIEQRSALQIPWKGADIQVNGNRLYAATSSGAFQVLDSTAPATPTVLHTLVIPKDAAAIETNGSDLFILNDSSGQRNVTLFDLTNPGLPTGVAQVTSLQTVGSIVDIAATNERLYLGTLGSGLQGYDVSDLAEPVALGSYGSNATQVAAAGDLAFVHSGSFTVVDFSVTPAAALDSVTGVGHADYFRLGTYVFGVSNKLTVVDVSDPPNVSIAWSSQLPWSGRAVVAQGGYTYTVGKPTFSNGSLHIGSWGVLEPPAPVGSYTAGGDVSVMRWADNRLYVARGHTLEVVDTTNPAAPVALGSYSTIGLIFDVEVEGDRVYLGTLNNRVDIVDVSDPTAMSSLGTYVGSSVLDLAVVGHRLYIAAVQLLILDVSNPAQPTLLGAHSGLLGIQNVVARGDHVYAASGYLEAVDVSNPAAPRRMDSTCCGHLRVSMAGDYLVTWYGVEPTLFAVADPNKLTWVGSSGINATSSVDAVVLHDNTVAVLFGQGGEHRVTQVDLSLPRQPALSAAHLVATGAEGLAVSDNLIAVGEGHEVRLYPRLDRSVILSPDHTLVPSGGTITYDVAWTEHDVGKDETVVCAVSGGSCTVVSTNPQARTASVEWSLPFSGSHEIAVAAGTFNFFGVARDQVQVQ